MPIKPPPTEFLGSPVVKYTVLESREGEAPYRAFVVTLADEERNLYSAHSIVADFMDTPWYSINGDYDLREGSASMLFNAKVQRGR